MDRVSQRAADLTAEERVAGTDDPEAQAEAILAASDERQADPTPEEERTSEETVEP
jgi:hypothetical protein